MKSIDRHHMVRVPRLIFNSIILLLLFFIYTVMPIPFAWFTLPGLNISGDQMIRLIILPIALIFLAKTLPDMLSIADKGANRILKILGIHIEEDPLRRVLKDITYLLTIIVSDILASPLLASIPNIGFLSNLTVNLIALGISLLLIYDIGRTLYNILEEKTEAATRWIAKHVNGGNERYLSSSSPAEIQKYLPTVPEDQ